MKQSVIAFHLLFIFNEFPSKTCLQKMLSSCKQVFNWILTQKRFNKALETKEKVKHFSKHSRDEDKRNFTCVTMKDAFFCLEYIFSRVSRYQSLNIKAWTISSVLLRFVFCRRSNKSPQISLFISLLCSRVFHSNFTLAGYPRNGKPAAVQLHYIRSNKSVIPKKILFLDNFFPFIVELPPES